MRKVEIQTRKRILDDFFKVDEVVLRHERADGRMTRSLRRLHLDRGDGIAALLFKPETGDIVLVRQFRYSANVHGSGWILEVVAGVLGPVENLRAAVRREILEETGYTTEKLDPISSFYLSPGGSSERIHLFYAEVGIRAFGKSGGGLEEEGEDIEVIEIPLEKAWDMLEAGRIVDAKTIIALQWLRSGGPLSDGYGSS